MKTIYLVLCLVINGDITYHSTINESPYKTMGECNQARENPIIQEDYQKMFPNNQILLICKEVRGLP